MSDLLPLLQFIFSGFWTWLGFLILVMAPLTVILEAFKRRGGSVKATKDSVEIETEEKP